MEKEQRMVNDLKPVLYDQSLIGDFVVYDVERNIDIKDGLRKDLTTIYPLLLGNEFPKTFGHYHQSNNPELYEVIEGQALFLCQKHSGNYLEIDEAYLIKAESGDSIIVLPGFSMTTINYGQSNVLMSNWVNNEIKNEYQLFSELQGACYYVLKGENSSFKFLKNNKYKKVPELIQLKPKKLLPELANLDFLISPEKYQNFLKVDNLYEKLN